MKPIARIVRAGSLLSVFSAGALLAQSLAGVADIHAHCDPDSVPRSIDALRLVQLAKENGFRAIVLKNHYEPTASWAALARLQTPGIEVFGGIALNRTVGGVNPAAVERMTRVAGGWGKLVWMPTFDAENQVRVNKETRPFVAVSRNGRLLPEVLEVLDLIARHKLVLATGHSAPEEVLLLIREAKQRGVARIVVTHAMLAPVSMTTSQMQQAARLGAMIEFVGNALIGQTKTFSFEQYVSAMRAVGLDSCVLSSDLGQKANPLHPDGLREIFRGLRAAGMQEAEIEQIAKRNPSRLLGLE